MIVSYIEVNKKVISNLSIDYLKSKFYDKSFEDVKVFYNSYCSKKIKAEDEYVDAAELEEDEIFLVGDIRDIKIRRAVKRLYFSFLEEYIFPLTFNFNVYEFGEDVFVINQKNQYLIGCAENMRYINGRVMNIVHLKILAGKFFGGF